MDAAPFSAELRDWYRFLLHFDASCGVLFQALPGDYRGRVWNYIASHMDVYLQRSMKNLSELIGLAIVDDSYHY